MKTIYAIVFITLINFFLASYLFCQATQEWVAIYNGNYDDHSPYLALDDSGNVLITGTSSVDYEAENFCTVKYNNCGVSQWISYYNGPAYCAIDEARCITTDHSGNVYVAGNSANITRDFAVIKYNVNGVVLWIARYDGPGYGYDNPVAITVDDFENVYVTGHSMGSGSNFDFATIKYNAAGTIEWIQRYNGPANSDDYPYDLALDNANNIFITGYSLGANGVNADCLTIKYNSSGVEQWIARYDDPAQANDVAKKIVVDSLGNSYITGSSRSSTFGTYSRCLTIKYNSDGAEQWVAKFGGLLGADGANDIVLDNFGNLFVAGTTYNNQSGYDYATIKYNSNGVQEWVNVYNGSGNGLDCVHSIAIDKWGDVYVTGESLGSGTNSNYVTIKYASEGIEQWIALYNRAETSLEEAFDMAVDDSGNVYVTGNSVTGVGYDFLTIKYSQLTTGILQDIKSIPYQFILEQNYPNPFNPSTTISWQSPVGSWQTIKLFDVLGREIETIVDGYYEAGNHSTSYIVNSSLTSGVYFYQLKVGDFIQTKKMILIK